eukprot:gene17621-21017_t
MNNNYNRIARYYDFLSRAVFFKAQVNAQTDQLGYIPPAAKILIAGGGTGWILNKIAELHPEGLRITYIEISSKMIHLAQKRNLRNNSIEFVNTAIEDYKGSRQFDVIMTAFLFDNFGKETMETAFSKLNSLLKPEGLWLFSDFSNQVKRNNLWQRFLLKTMYLFFRVVSNVEARELIDTRVYFRKYKLKKIIQKRYYKNFIKAVVYKKP